MHIPRICINVSSCPICNVFALGNNINTKLGGCGYTHLKNENVSWLPFAFCAKTEDTKFTLVLYARQQAPSVYRRSSPNSEKFLERRNSFYNKII